MEANRAPSRRAPDSTADGDVDDELACDAWARASVIAAFFKRLGTCCAILVTISLIRVALRRLQLWW